MPSSGSVHVDIRKKKGFSQMELSRRAGVTRQTITLIENNKYNPSLALCIKIAKALDSDLNTLFWEE
ncbi:helix-turn-helix transcriptional regulator [Liquorilactobacillus sicerae]|uniref:helix-turn-helix transcriptional regulator n=1 Tax=Liquorilactobacillus sicerae TaxID=1416943 RepID=UPI0024812ADD